MKSEEFSTTPDKKKQAQVPAMMSEKLNWLKCLLRNETLSAKSKNVATALFMCHNEKSGQCNPSQAYLAEATGMYRTAVNGALKELLDGGWVGRQKTRTTSLYRLEIAKAEVEASAEMSGERNIMMSGPPEIPLSGNRYIALSGPPDREPSREPSKRTTKLNTEPAEDDAPAQIEHPAGAQTVPDLQPETTPPQAANDSQPVLGDVEQIGGLKIPRETFSEWQLSFGYLDLRAMILKRANWALTIPEVRRMKALQTVLDQFNTIERGAYLDRKANAEARASAPPPAPPLSRFQLPVTRSADAVAKPYDPNSRYHIPPKRLGEGNRSH